MGRYNSRTLLRNQTEFYKEIFEKRGLKGIRHYNTPNMKYPTGKEIADSIERIPHLWKTGDAYWKLAQKYYGDAQMWWVIAWFNKKPTESHVEMGDTIQIPTPITTVMKYLKG